jgi:hypothetical protein
MEPRLETSTSPEGHQTRESQAWQFSVEARGTHRCQSPAGLPLGSSPPAVGHGTEPTRAVQFVQQIQTGVLASCGKDRTWEICPFPKKSVCGTDDVILYGVAQNHEHILSSPSSASWAADCLYDRGANR